MRLRHAQALRLAEQQRANTLADERRLHIQAAQLGRSTLGDEGVRGAQGDAGESHQVTLPLGEQYADTWCRDLLKKRGDGKLLLRFTRNGLANALCGIRVEEDLRGQCMEAKCILSLAPRTRMSPVMGLDVRHQRQP